MHARHTLTGAERTTYSEYACGTDHTGTVQYSTDCVSSRSQVAPTRESRTDKRVGALCQAQFRPAWPRRLSSYEP